MFVHAALDILHGHTYRVSVRGFNGVGLFDTIVSDGMSVDLEPPVAGIVSDGDLYVSGDVSLARSLTTVSAHWSPFTEPDSRIDHYEWCVGTSPGRGDVVACHDVGLALSATAHFGGDALDYHLDALVGATFGPDVAAAAVAQGGVTPDGFLSPAALDTIPEDFRPRLANYYSTVTAVNEVGLRTTSYSDGVRVDVEPPVVGVVLDSSSEFVDDVSVQTSDTTLWASWLGFVEYQTSIVHFELSVGTTPGDNDVVDAVVVPASTTAKVLHGLDLTTGTTYFVTVTAVDEAGWRSSNTSSGVLVDATPPVMEWVTDYDPAAEPELAERSVRTTGQGGNVTLSWSAVDDESGVDFYEVQLCAPLLQHSADTEDCPLAWTNVGLRTHIDLIAPDLASGVRYVATVRATSRAGLASTASSAGFMVDTTPPVAGTVTAVDPMAALDLLSAYGPGEAVPTLPVHSRQGTWELIAAQWHGFSDAESSIDSFSMCVGSSPMGQDLVPCHNVGRVFMAVVNASSASAFAGLDDIELRADRGNFTSCYVTVIAHSGANLTSSAVSEAIQVDASPPVPGVVFDGTTGADVEYIGAASELCVTAEGFYDAETDVVAWELCVGTVAGTCGVLPFTSVLPEEAVSDGAADGSLVVLCAREAPLTHNQRVYISVQAINGVGLSSSAVSDGVMVVLEDPPVGTVLDARAFNGSIVPDGQDVDLYGQRKTVGAVWRGFDQGIAPIVHYEVAICGSVSKCHNPDNALSFFANVGLTQNTTFAALALNEGETYMFHVRATDASGRASVAVSDGFLIDTSPPDVGTATVLSYQAAHSTMAMGGVDFGDTPLSEDEALTARTRVLEARARDSPLWHQGFAPLHVSWHGFGDPESGVATYEVCVSSAVEAAIGDLFPCTTIDDPTSRYMFVSSASLNVTLVGELTAQAEDAVEAALRDDLADLVVDPETGLFNGTANASTVQASFTAIVRVGACNSLGLCSYAKIPAVPVDLTPPVPATVTTLLDAATENEVATTAGVHTWEATWAPFVDTESGVAFYTAGVWDDTTGSYALPQQHLGTATGFRSAQLELQHGHSYRTIVTAFNHAGMSTTMLSNSTTLVDTTAPEHGWVYDIFDFDEEDDEAVDATLASYVDADFGDADLGSVEARWDEWQDPESGIAKYEWAILLVDPRARNPVDAEHPGELMRSAVAKFLAASGASLDLPEREYGTGRASVFFETDQGLLITDWLDVGNATFAFREDVDIITGATYVVLVRATNGAGLVTVSSSDGIVFDRSDPCMGRPHAGSDPSVVPAYLTVEGELSATWPAVADPLHQQDVPFVCLEQVSALTDAPTNQSAVEPVVTEVDVPVVPLSWAEWQLRKIERREDNVNATADAEEDESFFAKAKANGEDTDLTPVANVTGLDIDNSTNVNATADDAGDEPMKKASNATDSTVVMHQTQVGPAMASPWSGCCSSYGELNPTTMYQEWDWRPIHSMQGFGRDVSISATGRFVGVAGVGAAVVFDTRHTGATRTVTVAEVNAAPAATGPAADPTAVVHVAADAMFVLVTPYAMAVLQPSAATHNASAVHAMPTIAAARPFDALFTLTAPASVAGDFGGATFDGAVATLGDIIAVTVSGVAASDSAQAVVVLRVTSAGLVAVGGASPAASATFGASLALTAPPAPPAPAQSQPASSALVLLASEPSACGAQLLHHPSSHAACNSSSSDGTATHAFVVDGGVVTPASDSIFPPVSSPTASSAFGVALAASAGLVVVGDPDADGGRGAVSVLRVSSAGNTSHVCTLQGLAQDGMFGYSVSAVSALAQGRQHATNVGTSLVIVGAPSANMAVVVRVNETALLASSVTGGEDGDDDKVCQVVSVLRQSPDSLRTFDGDDAEVVPLLYGAGTSVAIGGGMVMFASPFSRTWSTLPSDTSRGRVFGATYCWAGDVRVPSPGTNVPTTCARCDVDSGEWSAGGVSQTCEDCAGRECRSVDDGFWFLGVNDTAPLENGAEYEVDVTVVSRSGRRNTQTSPKFKVDWTPPESGLVFDSYLGNASECAYCSKDLDATTNVTYLSISWCCGWRDLESDIASYSVSFGTVNATTSLLDWTPVGLNESFTLWDQDLVTGERYFGCVVAVNGAGLWTDPVCTDGVVYDDTPPAMVFVNDGLQSGFDVDAQSFMNLAFATYGAQDNETEVVEYLWSLGSSPGAADILAEESGQNATLNGVVNRPFLVELEEGMTMYASVRAINIVGLSSTLLSSDGIQVGKSEVAADSESGSTISLDTQYAKSGGADANATDEEGDAEPPKTLAAVAIPPGAVSEHTNFIGGAVTPEDIESGDAVNASEVKPPAQNLKFGDYSFTLKAKDPKTGQVDEGFAFEKPIRISMMYAIDKILEGEAAPTDWEPSLQIFDIDTGDWIPAKLTCPAELQWDEIDHARRTYSVDICHLTTFALFFQRRPVVVLEELPDELVEWVWTNHSDALQRITAGHAAADGVRVALVRLSRNATTGDVFGPTVPLDASRSYDPDGDLASVAWDMHATPYTLARAPSDAAPMALATNASVTSVAAVAGGLSVATATAIDTTLGERSTPVYFWHDEPPIAALGAKLAPHPPPVPHGEWGSMLVHGVTHAAGGSGTVSPLLNGTASWDREGSPLKYLWSVVGAPRPRYVGARTTPSPQVGSPAGQPAMAVVTGLPVGTVTTVALSVETQDEAAQTDTAVVDVVVNARPELWIDCPRAVFLPRDNITISIARSVDVDGSIVRRTWSVTQTKGTTATVSSFDTKSLNVTIDGVVDHAEFEFTVELEDNDGGVTHSGTQRVVFKNPSAAVAEAVASSSTMAVVSSPPWDGMVELDFSAAKSTDEDGALLAYLWQLIDHRTLLPVPTAAIAGADTVTARLVGGYTAGDYHMLLNVWDSANVLLQDRVPVAVLVVVDFAHATHDGLLSVVAPASKTNITLTPHLHPNVTAVAYEWRLLSSTLVAGGACAPNFTLTASVDTPTTTLTDLCGPGEYKVRGTVNVTADDGTAYSKSGTLTVVVHAPPTASVNTSMRAVDGTYLTVVGRDNAVSAALARDDRFALWFRWHTSPSDGVTVANATAPATTVTFAAAGEYLLVATVTDDVREDTRVELRVRVLPHNVSAALAAPLHRVVSTDAAFGGMAVRLDAGASVSTFSDIADFTWSVVATSMSAAPAPVLLSTLTSEVFRDGVTSPNTTTIARGALDAYDYTVKVVARDFNGATDDAMSVLRVLGKVGAPARVAYPIDLSAVKLTTPLMMHHRARSPIFSWSLVEVLPLSATPSTPPVACPGIRFVSAPSSSGTLMTAPADGWCGTGTYTVRSHVSLVERGLTDRHAAVVTHTVHMHERPVAVVELNVPAAVASRLRTPVPGIFATWVHSSDAAMVLTAASSSDDEGIAAYRWDVTRALSGSPHAPTGAVNASDILTLSNNTRTEVQADFLAPGVVDVTLSVTDVEGAVGTAMQQVWVCSSEEDANTFRFAPKLQAEWLTSPPSHVQRGDVLHLRARVSHTDLSLGTAYRAVTQVALHYRDPQASGKLRSSVFEASHVRVSGSTSSTVEQAAGGAGATVTTPVFAASQELLVDVDVTVLADVMSVHDLAVNLTTSYDASTSPAHLCAPHQTSHAVLPLPPQQPLVTLTQLSHTATAACFRTRVRACAVPALGETWNQVLRIEVPATDTITAAEVSSVGSSLAAVPGAAVPFPAVGTACAVDGGSGGSAGVGASCSIGALVRAASGTDATSRICVDVDVDTAAMPNQREFRATATLFFHSVSPPGTGPSVAATLDGTPKKAELQVTTRAHDVEDHSLAPNTHEVTVTIAHTPESTADASCITLSDLTVRVPPLTHGPQATYALDTVRVNGVVTFNARQAAAGGRAGAAASQVAEVDALPLGDTLSVVYAVRVPANVTLGSVYTTDVRVAYATMPLEDPAVVGSCASSFPMCLAATAAPPQPTRVHRVLTTTVAAPAPGVVAPYGRNADGLLQACVGQYLEWTTEVVLPAAPCASGTTLTWHIDNTDAMSWLRVVDVAPAAGGVTSTCLGGGNWRDAAEAQATMNRTSVVLDLCTTTTSAAETAPSLRVTLAAVTRDVLSVVHGTRVSVRSSVTSACFGDPTSRSTSFALPVVFHDVTQAPPVLLRVVPAPDGRWAMNGPVNTQERFTVTSEILPRAGVFEPGTHLQLPHGRATWESGPTATVRNELAGPPAADGVFRFDTVSWTGAGPHSATAAFVAGAQHDLEYPVHTVVSWASCPASAYPPGLQPDTAMVPGDDRTVRRLHAGVRSIDVRVACDVSAKCGERGACGAPVDGGMCACQPGAGGDDCSQCVEGAFLACGGRGSCGADGTCTCMDCAGGDAPSPSPSLDAAAQCLPVWPGCGAAPGVTLALPSLFGPACSATCFAPVTCSNHGVCADDGSCRCDMGWRGVACDTPGDLVPLAAAMQGWTAVVLGDATVSGSASTVEGSLAVGGAASLDAIDVATRVQHYAVQLPDNATALFVAGSALSFTSGSVATGDVVTVDTATVSVAGGVVASPGTQRSVASGSAAATALFDVCAATAELTRLADVVCGWTATGTVARKGATLHLHGARADTNVFDVSAANLTGATVARLALPRVDVTSSKPLPPTVVRLQVPQSVALPTGLTFEGAFADSRFQSVITWVHCVEEPNTGAAPALTVPPSLSLPGSLLAPRSALVVQDATVRGYVVAAMLNANGAHLRLPAPSGTFLGGGGGVANLTRPSTFVSDGTAVVCVTDVVCENGGVCVPAADGQTATCDCPDAWYGATCAVRVNRCHAVPPPCSGHGACTQLPDDDAVTCACSDMWSGDDCSVDPMTGDQCVGVTCVNGGRCTDGIGNFTCNCPAGTAGALCDDLCPDDPAKTAPGACGCGVADTNSDGDAVPDCLDGCPNTASKTTPGQCGCGVADVDTDGDGVADCVDACPLDTDKAAAPGVCGCGVADYDYNGDGVVDCPDGCTLDPAKTAPGVCGCGVPDTDTDRDGAMDLCATPTHPRDLCIHDAAKTEPGVCGCGLRDDDRDMDGAMDNCATVTHPQDRCPANFGKVAPGLCGCTQPDADADANGVVDCLDTATCSGCTGGDVNGPCKSELDGTCFQYVPGTGVCPAGSVLCAAPRLGPVLPPCSGCAGDSAGACANAQSTCSAAVGPQECPAGTTACGAPTEHTPAQAATASTFWFTVIGAQSLRDGKLDALVAAVVAALGRSLEERAGSVRVTAVASSASGDGLVLEMLISDASASDAAALATAVTSGSLTSALTPHGLQVTAVSGQLKFGRAPADSGMSVAIIVVLIVLVVAALVAVGLVVVRFTRRPTSTPLQSMTGDKEKNKNKNKKEEGGKPHHASTPTVQPFDTPQLAPANVWTTPGAPPDALQPVVNITPPRSPNPDSAGSSLVPAMMAEGTMATSVMSPPPMSTALAAGPLARRTALLDPLSHRGLLPVTDSPSAVTAPAPGRRFSALEPQRDPLLHPARSASMEVDGGGAAAAAATAAATAGGGGGAGSAAQDAAAGLPATGWMTATPNDPIAALVAQASEGAMGDAGMQTAVWVSGDVEAIPGTAPAPAPSTLPASVEDDSLVASLVAEASSAPVQSVPQPGDPAPPTGSVQQPSDDLVMSLVSQVVANPDTATTGTGEPA